MTSVTDPGFIPASPTASVAREAAKAAGQARVRDPRLDFFRGICMFIILIAHTPGNWLTLWIPARFGFSDATEIFVFLSGMASAIAFGGVFARRGWWMGTARVAFRIWQVYWAHIGLFIAVATAMVVLNKIDIGTRDYVGQLNLYPFFNGAKQGLFTTQDQLLGLVTLTYVPNYFDILPMYLVVLAMMPLVYFVGHHNRYVLFAVLITLWGLTQLDVITKALEDDAPRLWWHAFIGWGLPAEPWSQREWFFNPFGWQLVFFTGFAFMIGWLPAPPVRWWLIALAAVAVLSVVPFAYFKIYREFEWIKDVRAAIAPFREKTDFGLFRYLHFLALAYLAWVAVGPRGARLTPPSGGIFALVWSPLLAAIMKVGQQSLAIFITSMFLARLLGVALDEMGRSHASMALVNLTGFAILIAVAYAVGWFKSQPWRSKKA
ncbi:MAG: OpgC domain-containing protein [Pseudomonadota bacterium]